MATIPRVLLSRTNESASPVCPFMARSGRQKPQHVRPLTSTKRTFRVAKLMSASDPKMG